MNKLTSKDRKFLSRLAGEGKLVAACFDENNRWVAIDVESISDNGEQFQLNCYDVTGVTVKHPKFKI